MPALCARRGGALCHLREVSALLARCTPARDLWQSLVAQFTPTRAQEWAVTLGASVGLRTINERINQLEARLAHVHREPISEVPAVVQFDGIWLSMQTQQDGIHEDSRKRKRHGKSGKRVVVLGLWTDGS